uniref:Protein YIPF5 n=2 Tax=Cacopsylla melanoneura TaxID=428564 RepID=A0A8D8LI69_9HEMI
MAGPLTFCLAFGGFLLLAGKVHFSYIYGFGVVGCLAMYGLLYLMATSPNVNISTVTSVLGYCLLPMVVLAGVNVVISLQGAVGLGLTILTVLWCAMSASKLLVTCFAMSHQQPLVAYPCAILYSVFALITVF